VGGDADLYTARPLVHQPVQPDLEQFIVPDGSVRHDHPVVELIKRPFPLPRSVVIAQLDQTSVSLVESDLVVVEKVDRG